MKVKYETTIYSKKHPYGYIKTVVVNGEQCEKPSYLCGCNEGYMFIRTKAGKIHMIETDRILEIVTEMESIKKWRVVYVVGNTYKTKYVFAATNTQAIKKARVKNIVDLEEQI